MIPVANIIRWSKKAPWSEQRQIEQDLVISRAIVAIFSHPLLSEALAFRGGTALYKLHPGPPLRYSEDIDLVQIKAGPAGPVMDALHEILNPWLGKPRRKQGKDRITFSYRFASEDIPPEQSTLKIEINTREHFSAFGFKTLPFAVQSAWFSGHCNVLSYSLDELLGTKLRALYQRKKGRDLFDIHMALRHDRADPKRIIEAFNAYLDFAGHAITRETFGNNLQDKLGDRQFAADIEPLLAAGNAWNRNDAANMIFTRIIALLPSRDTP